MPHGVSRRLGVAVGDALTVELRLVETGDRLENGDVGELERTEIMYVMTARFNANLFL